DLITRHVDAARLELLVHQLLHYQLIPGRLLDLLVHGSAERAAGATLLLLLEVANGERPLLIRHWLAIYATDFTTGRVRTTATRDVHAPAEDHEAHERHRRED